MIKLRSRDEAVSPAIGTILLVAITVVLVAVILGVVMGFSGDPNEKKVGLHAEPAGGPDATLILYGGASVPELVKLEMIDQGSPYGEYVEFWNSSSGEAFVGTPYRAENVAQPEESMAVYDTIINVRGTFTDGKEIVLLVQPMTFYDVTGHGPKVSAPVATGKTINTLTVRFTYENIIDARSGMLYYHPKGKSEQVTSTPVTVTSGSESSGYATGQLWLAQCVDYVIWGTITTADGQTITGASSMLRTQDPVVEPEITWYHNGFNTPVFEVRFSNYDTYVNGPSKSVIFYLQSADGTVVTVDSAKGGGVIWYSNSVTSHGASSFTGLETGNYKVWAVMRFNDVEISTDVMDYTKKPLQ
jgi:flagellin-like protein